MSKASIISRKITHTVERSCNRSDAPSTVLLVTILLCVVVVQSSWAGGQRAPRRRISARRFFLIRWRPSLRL